ncbi:MAG: hypothetical protein HWE27_06740 [Gammaproteobacteria bacterium]|nr:hypothetical protein [Gammaproteobacteria bacterium]
MKCVFDTTINLKQLVSTGIEKLMLPVNGKPMLDQHFSNMSQAGVTSLFVLIETESSLRPVIAREALKYGFNPTFLEVEQEQIADRKSIMIAEPYLKDVFLYWPANRLVSDDVIRSLVEQPMTNHQMASVVYTGKSHPHCDKPGIYKVVHNANNQAGDDNPNQPKEPGTPGFDIGVYKCGTIIFKLIKKVAENRALSWNRIQTALSRAGRSIFVTTESDHWALIETKKDIETLETLLASRTIDRADLNNIDKSVFEGLYSSILPPLLRIDFIKSQGASFWLLGIVIGLVVMLLGNWLFLLGGTLVVACFMATYPIIEFVGGQSALVNLLKNKSLAVFRILIVSVFSILCFKAFGLGFWTLISFLTLGAEIYFVIKPEPIHEQRVESITSSFAIHTGWLLCSIFFFLSTLTLFVYSLLSLSISITKGLQVYKAYQRDKE